MFDNLSIDNAVTVVLGAVVLLSIFLSRVFWDGFLWLAIIAGVLALQSAFTGFCPTANLLRKFNLVR